MFVIRNTKIFLTIAGVLMLVALTSVFVWGLHPGVDFTGGTIVEVGYPDQRPAKSEIEEVVSRSVPESFSVRSVGDAGYSIRTSFLSEDERSVLVEALGEGKEITLERVSSIGPSVGDELTGKSEIAIGVVIVAIILFIAFSFRKVNRTEEGEKKSQGVSSWFYGLAAIVALIFDTLIPTGVFALLGEFTNAQVDILFITALLAILGYSVNDTIVVFDRIRERLNDNKELNRKEEFNETVGISLNQTVVRSINTSLTTAVVLSVLFIVGGSTTEYFSLTLLAGVLAGTYSSIFLASPLLVVLSKLGKSKEPK